MSLPKLPAMKMLKKPVSKSVRGMSWGTAPGAASALKRFALEPVNWKKLFMRKPMGGMPGIVPGHTLCGHTSFCAGAPNITGGVLTNVSSSFGNLKPASLKAFPKSFSFGKSRWQVVHEVPYCREKAGIA